MDNSAPAWPRKQWLPIATSDAAILYTTLFVTAFNLCVRDGKPFSPEVFFYKGEAIKLINKRIGDTDSCVSDSLICSVAALAQLELVSYLLSWYNPSAALATGFSGGVVGYPGNAKTHMDGLEAMVKCRGGLKTLGMNGVPKRLAVW